VKKYIYILVISLFFIETALYGQLSTSGDLRSHIFSIINGMPDAVDGDTYVEPTSNQLDIWGNVIDEIIIGNYADAHIAAQTIDYQLVEYDDSETNSTFYLLEKTNAGTNYWGTFIYDPTPLRARLFIQAPHPKKDFNTGKQGYHVFLNTGAAAYLVAGTSRCNSSTYSSCDGTTSVCADSSEAYRVSDQAHSVNSIFQRTTERFEALTANMIYIQLHGFEKKTTDPYVIMSNGIDSDTPPNGFQYLESLRTNLELQDTSLSYVIAHEDPNWDRLIGSTNTQGRYINGNTIDPCTTSANQNSGRFLHLEQEKTKLRSDSTGWNKMANALASTFLDLLPVELSSFTAELSGDKIILNWQTETEVNNYGFEIERQKLEARSKKIEERWEKVGFVEGSGNSNSQKEYSFIDDKPSEGFKNLGGLDGILQYRLKQIDFDGKIEYSNIVEVEVNTLPMNFALEQNYPNPFNPSTSIEYSVPNSEYVSLKVYDILGNEVATLVNEQKSAGNYEVKFNASSLTTGMYIYKIQAGSFIKVRKMMLVK
jgi:hypothetical protein